MNAISAAVEPLLLHTWDARGIHRLQLNRPAGFNTLSQAMIDAMQAALDTIALDESARAVVIAAEGKAFCAGHNLKEMQALTGLEDYQKLFADCSRMMLAIQSLPVPVLARVQGLATAAGCQLVAQCDLAVASNAATFGVNGIDIGLFCATPSVPLVRNIPCKQAFEMLVTGAFINADEALVRGLVNRVVAPEQLDAEIENMVAAIVQKPRVAIAMGKVLFYRQRETGMAAAYQLAGQSMACNLADPAALEGMRAFVEKRPPQWLTGGIPKTSV